MLLNSAGAGCSLTSALKYLNQGNENMTTLFFTLMFLNIVFIIRNAKEE